MPLLNEFSIQLYSVREETARDFTGVLRRLAQIGYTGVEFAGYGGVPAEEMRRTLEECGMKSIGSHVGMDRLVNNLEEELSYNQTIGTKYIIVPYADIKTHDEALRLAEFLNEKADVCAKAGFLFGYHNHSHEFVRDGGGYLLDTVFANTSPEKVFMELDLYWAAYAGVDPLAYMEANKGLLKLLHIKQIRDYESKQCVDLDDGVIDFQMITARGLDIGIESFILEQEEFAVSPYISVEKGFNHMMKL